MKGQARRRGFGIQHTRIPDTETVTEMEFLRACCLEERSWMTHTSCGELRAQTGTWRAAIRSTVGRAEAEVRTRIFRCYENVTLTNCAFDRHCDTGQASVRSQPANGSRVFRKRSGTIGQGVYGFAPRSANFAESGATQRSITLYDLPHTRTFV